MAAETGCLLGKNCRHYRLKLVASIAATLPDVISLLEQINKVSGTGYAAIDLENSFFSFQLEKGIKVCDSLFQLEHVYSLKVVSLVITTRKQ